MSFVSIADSRDYFVRNGQPFFYLADTVWSAFTAATREEWAEYLELRRQQGFNVLQINILPQWDRSEGDVSEEPFAKDSAGSWDFRRPNGAYFERARDLTRMAWERGFVPALVLLWCDYVAGTWGAQKAPGHTIPSDAVQPYVRYVADQFAEFEPIFLVSGDTDFKSEQTTATYSAALEAIKHALPGAPTTFHLNPDTDLPEQIVESSDLDFYMYQSGHLEEHQDGAYGLAELFRAKPVKRPVVNGEPCYEGHGFGFRYGRFGAFHVRKAIWQSLLAGAKAGVTYGAHGLWNWHERGRHYPNIAFSSQSYPWRSALHFSGAWDVGFSRWVFETYGFFDLEPVPTRKLENPEIRMAATADGRLLAAYLPYPAELSLGQDLRTHDCWCVDLATRRFFKPELKSTSRKTTLLLPEVEMDTLFVAVGR